MIFRQGGKNQTRKTIFSRVPPRGGLLFFVFKFWDILKPWAAPNLLSPLSGHFKKFSIPTGSFPGGFSKLEVGARALQKKGKTQTLFFCFMGLVFSS